MATSKRSPRARSETPAIPKKPAAKKAAAKKAPAAKKPATALTPKAFAPAGPVHWGYPFTVEVAGERGAAIRAFLERFTTITTDEDISGYGVVDDDDTATAARYFNKNRPVITASDFDRQSPAHLTEDERLQRLDRALGERTSEAYSETEMLLATWPDDQHPDAAEARALAALEAWPTYFRGGTTRSQRAADAGDLSLHRKFVRSQGSKDIDERLSSGRFDDTELLYVDDIEVFLKHRAALPRVRALNVRGVPTTAQWDALKETPLDAIAVQDFTSRNVTGLDTARWWDAPLGRSLHTLTTYGIKIGAAELKPLTRGDGHLRHLKLENARLTGAAAGKAIAAIGALHPLESMTLPYNELGPAGVAAMFAGAGHPSLRALTLSANEIGDEGTVAIARSPGLGELRWLSLSSNATEGPITAVGAQALGEAASLRNLHSLFLMGQPLQTDGVAALLASAALPRLRKLNVSYTSATWGALIAKLDGVETLPVTHLDASSWYGGPKPKWKDARFLRSVTHLRVEALPGGEFAKFLSCGNLDNVEVLVLGGVYAQHDKAHRALCDAEALPRLKVLSIHGWKMGVPQAKALCGSALVRALEGIDLMASGYVSPEAAKVFLDAGVRVVTSPEFSEYVANDVRSADFSDEGVAD